MHDVFASELPAHLVQPKSGSPRIAAENLSFDWEAPLGLDISATYDYTGSMEVPHYADYIPEDCLEISGDFHVFNMVVSRHFDLTDTSRMRVYLNIQNIGDTYQPDLD